MADNAQDETSGFVVTNSDIPEPAPTPAADNADAESQASQPEAKPENTDGSASEAKPDKAEGQEEQPKGEDPAPNAGEQANTDDSADEPNKPKRSAQKRINKEVKRRAQAEAKSAELERTVQELQQKIEALSEPEPKEDDFEDYDDYLKAVEDHESKQGQLRKDVKALAKAKAEAESDQKTVDDLSPQDKAALKTANELISEQIKSSANLPDDFQAKVIDDRSLPISVEMVKALSQAEDAPQVMYHLAENRELASEISEMGPGEAFAAIIRLDEKLANKPPKAAPAKPVKVPSAPEPIDPVGTSDTQKSIEKMSFAEYEAHMNQQTKGRRVF